MKKNIFILALAALSTFACESSPVIAMDSCPSMVIEPKYYSQLNLEEFPVQLKPNNETEISNNSSYYQVNICRGNNLPFEVYKVVSGEISFGFEYQYEGKELTGIKMLFLNGSPTKYRIMQEI